MSDKHLDPAKSVIAKIGIEKVAEITGKHVSRVYRWMYPRERGGTNGFIPPADAQSILKYAKESGISLSPSEFIVPIEQVDAEMFDEMVRPAPAGEAA